MRRSLALLAVAALLWGGAALAKPEPAPQAEPPPAASAPPPKLIVAIAVDQFSADLFAQYRGRFTGGLARLQQGTVFPSGYQGHAATETCPGHSTLLTGARPSRTGIIANYWYDPSLARADKRVYCSEDTSNPDSSSRNPVVSPATLRVPTLGEWAKKQWPESRNVAVSAKDRAVVMMGGHVTDAAYWWKQDAFVSYQGRELSRGVKTVNTAAAALIAKGAPAFALPAWCGPRDRSVPVADFAIGASRFAQDKGKPDEFRASPRMDAATVDLALKLVDEMKLGKGAAPDVLSVSLSASDYIGHAYGNEGAEMCIQMAELDKTVGRLLTQLDVRKIDYAVVLTSDHGGADATERLNQQGVPGAAHADGALLPRTLGDAIGKAAGIAAPAGQPGLVYGDGPFGDYYIAAGLTADQHATVLRELISRLEAAPQVAAVFDKLELGVAPRPTLSPQDWALLQRARESYDAERSGDVVVLLKRGVSPIVSPGKGYVSTHGSAWDYDRRVPMLFWRKGIAGMEQPAPVETVDIAPTLAALIGLKVPEGAFDGRCLDIDGGEGDTCQRETGPKIMSEPLP